MTDNLRIWNQCKQVPTQHLKPIQAGRLKGKSDISPQWRMQIMTEMYGPCGVGWKYTIDRLWTEKGHGEEVFAFAQISLYTKEDTIYWSEPIPGIGGHFLIEQESRGPHNNDEAYKMATTDALGVAMKALGVAADIYLGLFDGSKYMKEAPKPVTGDSSKGKTPAAVKEAPAGFSPHSDERNEWGDAPKKDEIPEFSTLLSFDELREKILATTALPHLKNVWVKYKADVAMLSVEETERLTAVKDAKKKELSGGSNE